MEQSEIQYRAIIPGEEIKVCQLVKETFDSIVAPAYSPEGIEVFYQFANPVSMRKRMEKGAPVYIAMDGAEIAGMIEVRDTNHIALFFVAPGSQRKGIGKGLFRLMSKTALRQFPGLDHFSVNASPNSVAVYKNLGFMLVGTEELKSGIRFIPMECWLK